MIRAAVLLLLLALPVQADWPQLRGPRANGHAGVLVVDVPLKWSEEENVAWKVPVPGLGHSSPVIRGEQIWLTTAIAKEESESLHALAFNVNDGKLLHNVELFHPKAFQVSHPDNSYASPTPVIEEGRVYVHFGAYGTAALNTGTGEVLWKSEEIVVDHEVGPGSSPILFEDLMIVNFDGTDRQLIVAFKKETGEIAWTTPRTFAEGNKPPHKKAFSTPIVLRHRGKPQLITAGADQVAALDPQSGEQIWEVRYEGYSVVPQPVTGLGMVFVNTGYMKPHLLAIRLGGQGDVTASHIVWDYFWQVPANPSPLLIGDRIFLMGDWGKASWLDARRGEDLWRQRVGGRHWASPLFVDGRIYTWSEEGETVVMEPGDTFKELQRNHLEGIFHATPAVINGAFIVRSTTHLYCLGSP